MTRPLRFPKPRRSLTFQNCTPSPTICRGFFVCSLNSRIQEGFFRNILQLIGLQNVILNFSPIIKNKNIENQSLKFFNCVFFSLLLHVLAAHAGVT